MFRKPNPLYFSIEKVFDSIIPHFPAEVGITRSFIKSERAGLKAVLLNLRSADRTGDIFHITGDIHYMALVYPRTNTMLTIHDCIFMNNSAGIKKWIMKWLWLKLPVQKSRIVTVISESTKQDVIKYTGCNPDKVVVVPDPISEIYTYSAKVFNDALPRILQVGTWPNKNLPRLIEALQGVSAELVIIGKLNEEYLQLLKNSGIRFLNRFNISESELAEEYALADMVVFASTFEGFGLPIIEAQATGRIVITSNLQPMSVVAGDAAILVDPFDIASIKEGILEGIHNKERRNDLISKGLKNVKQYRPQEIAAKYYKLYQQMLN